MVRKRLLRFHPQNIEEEPRFQETVTVGEHLDVGGDHRHCSDADVAGFVERVEEDQERVQTVHRHDEAALEREIFDEPENVPGEEQRRKCKRNLHIFRVALVENGSCATELVNLFGELSEIDTAFVINPDIVEKSSGETVFPERHRKIGIFTDAHFGEAADFFECRFFNAHIETSRLEFGDGFFASADSASCENGGHRIGNRLLHEVKTTMRLVCTAECVARNFGNIFLDVFDIVFFHNHIGIHEDEPVVFCPSCAIVSGQTRSRIVFPEKLDIDRFLEKFDGVPKIDLRTIIHNDHFEIVIRLMGKRIEELEKFASAVVDGDDEGDGVHGFIM